MVNEGICMDKQKDTGEKMLFSFLSILLERKNNTEAWRMKKIVHTYQNTALDKTVRSAHKGFFLSLISFHLLSFFFNHFIPDHFHNRSYTVRISTPYLLKPIYFLQKRVEKKESAIRLGQN